MTIVEAQNGPGWRYYKAYVAEKLEGPWQALAASKDDAFASLRNVTQPRHWTDSISHGELIRAGIDERMEIDPHSLRFVFQGVLDRERQGLPYGQIPWKLGLLEAD
ncbi:Alpha-L-arabinofuranosidase C [bacterium HR36]|nr:Alpha-L-arabinofuranosidase C [bacterium HR36]